MNYFKRIRGHYNRFIRKHFHSETDAIKDGFLVFGEYADIYGDEISDFHHAVDFFETFINEYGRCVNVDFLDTDNWDNIKKVKADFNKQILTLYWHLPIQDEELRMMHKMAFPHDLYGLAIHFHSIRFIRDKKKKCIAFAINGYTEKEKDIKAMLNSDGFSIVGIDNSTSFFSIDVIRHNTQESEFIRFMKTPIVSFLVIPKKLTIHPQNSEKLLYGLNLQDCKDRLSNAIKELDKLKRKKLNKKEEEDNLKNIGNSLRRVAENLFKLILCFYQEKYKFKPQDYNERLLGDIISPIKRDVYTSEEDKEHFSTIVRIANDLSHETGKPVSYEMLMELHLWLMFYVQKFKIDIDFKHVYLPDSNNTKDNKPSPKDFMENNYQSWDFTDIISSTIKNSSGLLKFRFKFLRNGHFFLFEDNKYLCNNGRIQKINSQELDNCLVVWNRNELKILHEQLNDKIESLCDAAGYAGNEFYFHFYFSIELERVGKPTHLFTEEEIKKLMLEANDGVNNKLVIDEDGYAHIIQQTDLGTTYPVSQETWCAGNNYVGAKSTLSDLHDSYVFSLHNWLIYLKTGRRVYGDLWVSDAQLDVLIEEIRTYY